VKGISTLADNPFSLTTLTTLHYRRHGASEHSQSVECQQIVQGTSRQLLEERRARKLKLVQDKVV